MKKNSFHPLVSIVIPVYNGENYMKEAIDSALNQTYDNIEVIVVNDGSKDNTDEIAKSYGNKIRYFKKQNGGAASALNYGIEKMKGEYFSWLSHDDIYKPDKIKSCIDVLSKEKNKKQVVYCDVEVVDKDKKLISNTKVDSKLAENMLQFLAFDTNTGLNGCSLLIPKSAFDECGLFDTEAICTQDYDEWFRISEKYSFIYCPEHLVLSRRHPMQDSVTKTDICTDEADLLHAKMISAMDSVDNLSINYLIDQYKLYYISAYFLTAEQILIKIKKSIYYKNKDERIMELLDSSLTNEKGIDKINKLYKKKSKKRIVFYNNVWINGGVEKTLSTLFPKFKDYEIIVLANQINDNIGSKLPDNYYEVKEGNNNILLATSLLDADIFVGNPNIVSNFIDIYKSMKNFNIKTIAIMHYNYFLPYSISYFYPIVNKKNEEYANADVVSWLTPYYNYIYSIFNDNGICIPNPSSIEKNDFKPSFKTKNIVSVGRFDDYVKRIDNLLKVFKKVYDLDNEFKLTVVGNFDKESFKEAYEIEFDEFVKKENIPVEKIEFVGEQNDVSKYYKDSGLYLGTPDSEGFGMCFLEAFSYGLPVAMFNIPGLDILIKPDHNSIICESEDYDDLANKIIDLFSDKKHYELLSNNAKKTRDDFDIDIISNEWLKVFDALLNNKEKDYIIDNQKKYKNDYSKDVIIQYEKACKSIINDERYKILERENRVLTDDCVLLNEQVVAIATERDQLLDKVNTYNLGRHNYLSRLKQGIRQYGPFGALKRIIKKIISKIFKSS